MAQMTPMMQQYVKTKEEYRDCILFYRLGDFYEMFFEDALLVSKELELTLTGKDCGLEERAPMCGIPYHAVEGYLAKLVSRGYKVAICEQVEDPKQAKGLVKREVIRIVTPGTNLNPQSLDESRNNYIMCTVYLSDRYGLSIADVTTGDYFVTEVDNIRRLLDEVQKFNPSEIICNHAFYVSGVDIDDLKSRLGMAVYALDDWYFDDELCRKTLLSHFKVSSLEGLGIGDMGCGVIGAGALLKYLEETQKNDLSHMTHITPYAFGKYMLLDGSTRRNLELTETLREKRKKGSLLWVLDKTRTAMGARLLRSMVVQPVFHRVVFDRRLEAIEELNSQMITREELREYLNPIYDLERLIGRISYQTANARDLIAFKTSLAMLPPIRTLLEGFHSPQDLDTLEDIHGLIEAAVCEEPPVSLRDGEIIKDGFHQDVDKYRRAKTEGKTWLAKLEVQERERTGIKNLRVKFNKVFGYYLEVTNSYKDLVPEDYMRKQTLVNAERYITPELKELEDTILGAEDKLNSLEYELFCKLRDEISAQVLRIQRTAKAVAQIDVFTSLSLVAQRNSYVRPVMNEKGIIDIRNGRHPVVEQMISNDMFIANDTYLDNGNRRVSVITGPNMAGKSTYMRQAALIVLMAQIGSFVPADSAKIGIVDRIFTRVGASDDLASGQSTFMVEMTEVANILRNATRDSLLILDEIGRGTSTFDGLSIAWSVIEYISNPKILGAKTLFATHYHELTELEGSISGVNNYCIAVKEKGDDIVFLRKIVKGGADRSYGIQVAKLAGVPDPVIARAKELLESLVAADISAKNKVLPVEIEMEAEQISLMDTVKDDDIIGELRELELSSMTPIEALNVLYRLQNKIRNRW